MKRTARYFNIAPQKCLLVAYLSLVYANGVADIAVATLLDTVDNVAVKSRGYGFINRSSTMNGQIRTV